jgi:hypothetical protein
LGISWGQKQSARPISGGDCLISCQNRGDIVWVYSTYHIQ